jgi:hypothetical protein
MGVFHLHLLEKTCHDSTDKDRICSAALDCIEITNSHGLEG